MYIFYDFETSSRELIGQVLSYAFVVTDANLHPIAECEGLIRLNRIQLPEIDAILINRIDVMDLQQKGETEYDAALKIYHFLSHI